nr:target of Myb protein 1-like isoform X1 [Ipomoea batatas]
MPPQFPQQQNLQSPESSLYANRNASGTMSPQYEQSPYPQGSNALWNGHITQQEHPASPVYGSQDNGAFPAPPWEAETTDSNSMCGSPCMYQNNQVLGGSPNSLSMQTNQFAGSPHAFQMQNNQLGGSPHALQMQNNQLGVSPRALSVLTNSQLGGSPHTLPVQNNQLGGNPHALTMQNNQLVAMNHPQFPGAVFANGSQLLGNEQVGGVYGPGGHFTVNQAIQSSQLVGLNPQHHQSMGLFSQQMPPSAQMLYMYSQQTYTNQLSGYGCGFGQQQNSQLLEQRMSGLNIQDDDGILKGPPYLASTPSSYVPVTMGKSTNPEDKLFGDLVDVSKFKSSKPDPARAGSRCP